ncbi:MAG: hypothetical protein K6A65_09560 [Succinivibrionaceae bacterium]|nr:hypothetical protein [Succinivibrionaceae bacterium]
MDPLSLVKGFDEELRDYICNEMERVRTTLSFIPDENRTSVLAAAMKGSVTFNNWLDRSHAGGANINAITCKRLCDLFHAEYANVSCLTIETASRVVFKSVTKRGDVVMSLDLRKREHCNSEDLAFRFVNFGVDPKTQRLDYDSIARLASECHPQLIIVSPINYPLSIDYRRFAEIAHAVGAVLWCDISQTCGLIAGHAIPSPFPFADIVTFSTLGALQGPQTSVILTKSEYARSVERIMANSRHIGLPSSKLVELSARLRELQDETYGAYVNDVMNNARVLAEGLRRGGMTILCGGTETHLVMIDTRSCAISSRGAQEILADAGVRTRICNMLTQDPGQRADAIRFSTLPLTTRGLQPNQFAEIGEAIGKFLMLPDESETKLLKDKVREMAASLPEFNPRYVSPVALGNLRAAGLV